jgi:uncharacterized Zn finger protein (UPF0148 family)
VCGAVESHLGDVDVFHGGVMCELLSSLRGGALSDMCDHHCHDEVTTLFQQTGCTHSVCQDCTREHAVVAEWEVAANADVAGLIIRYTLTSSQTI